MTVRSILERKGRDVVTVAPEQTLADAARQLSENRIGAVVLVNAEQGVLGILSERDIVRAIAAEGSSALEKPISAFMTSKVQVCNESATVNEVMQVMTQGRFRHLPVAKDGKLVGLVSIGDVVKWRMEEVEREAEEIRTYIATA
ncbi:inosine-5-monophosphate dehydrogenase [Nitratireductor aestuarii]|uniref:Inosine-5-monophosphate dehydrogenase n=1 Tax=Nitratireductor aestuarii TaxID=1735103 RepID=A0A916VZ17_9HYPH|nr:CBS domain-containing protein [Nitratireductor aestuarii]GGA53767.1 inosine-5-monophosphate dehydrogenase [Nitratireductor aestuarii]